MAVALDQFVTALAAAGILTEADVDALQTSLPDDERPTDGESLAKLLVARKKLTAFQSQHLLAGRGGALTIGEYLVIERIGSGGMGTVYKGQHRRMGRVVALKMMSAAALKDESSVKRFQREVRAAARLEHPNIVTAYDAGLHGKNHYLVMQYVEGGDLASLVKTKGPLSIDRAVEFTLQAARGLAFAHEQGVVHRDIKPANLLIDRKGQIKILDMGLARFDDGESTDGLTTNEQVMGTVDYMSPEQASDSKNADGRSDIYSLGCTLWFLLTGKRLYDGETMIARLVKHRDAPLPSLTQERDDVPWPLEQALHKMIAKRKEDRYATMKDVVAAFEQCRASQSGAGSSVLHDADLANFFQGMGSTIQSGLSRPGSSSTVRPGSGSKITASPSTIKPASSPSALLPGAVEATAMHLPAAHDTDPHAVPMAKAPAAQVVNGPSAASGKRPPAPAAVSARKSARSPLPMIVGGLAGGVFVIGLAVWMLKSTSGPSDPGAPIATAADVAPVSPAVPVQTATATPAPVKAIPALPATPVDFAAERRAAEFVLAKGGIVTVLEPGKSSREFRDGVKLPPGNWIVQKLSLHDKHGIRDLDLIAFRGLSQISDLELGNCDITGKALMHLSRLTTLRYLELDGSKAGDADVAELAGIKGLVHLKLNGTKVSEDGLAKLALGGLQKLEIGGVLVGNKLTALLRDKAPLLRELHISDCAISDAALPALAGMKYLNLLEVKGANFTDKGMTQLAAAASLRDLRLRSISITDAGLKPLATMQNLRTLRLNDMVFADEALAELSQVSPKVDLYINDARLIPRDFPQPTELPGAAPPNTLTAAEKSAGWKLLFDGRSFVGWKPFRRNDAKPRGWWVLDGQLRGDGGAEYLCTVADFDFYDFTFEFRTTQDGNSGINYQVDETLDNVNKSGPEFELDADSPTTGIMWDVGVQDSKIKLMSLPMGWYRGQLTTAPGRARHRFYDLQGKLLFEHVYLRDSAEYRTSKRTIDPLFWKTDRGKITLQAMNGSVAFRNLKLRPMKPDEAAKLIDDGSPKR